MIIFQISNKCSLGEHNKSYLKCFEISNFLTCSVLCYSKNHTILNNIIHWSRDPLDIYIYTSSFGKKTKQKNTLLYLAGAARESDRKACLWIFRFHNTWSVVNCFCAVDMHTYTESFNRHCYMLIAPTARWTVKLPIQHSAQLSDLSCFLPHMFWALCIAYC